MDNSGYVVVRTDSEDGVVLYTWTYRFPSEHYHDLWVKLYPDKTYEDWQRFRVQNA